MVYRFTLSALFWTMLSTAALAQEFDRSLLSGEWVESDDTDFACTKDKPHQRFELSEDGKTLVFKIDRKLLIATGKAVDQYSATVILATPRALVIEYNNTEGAPKGFPKAWELAFIAPGVFRWRATEWPVGHVNRVVGVRCSP
jgi:hypothetical protein